MVYHIVASITTIITVLKFHWKHTHAQWRRQMWVLGHMPHRLPTVIFQVTSEPHKLRHATLCGFASVNKMVYSILHILGHQLCSYCMAELLGNIFVAPLNYFLLVSSPTTRNPGNTSEYTTNVMQRYVYCRWDSVIDWQYTKLPKPVYREQNLILIFIVTKSVF